MAARSVSPRHARLSFRKQSSHTVLGIGLLPMQGARDAQLNVSQMDAQAVGVTRSTAAAAAPDAGGVDLFVQLAAGLAQGHDLRGLLERLLEPVMALAGARAGAVRLFSE